MASFRPIAVGVVEAVRRAGMNAGLPTQRLSICTVAILKRLEHELNNDSILFNRPHMTGKELRYINEAKFGNIRAAGAAQTGGRLLTVDPCLDPFQNPIARMLVRGDGGQNVRDKAGYEALARAVFESPRVEVKHRVWIPYTHCFMECLR